MSHTLFVVIEMTVPDTDSAIFDDAVADFLFNVLLDSEFVADTTMIESIDSTFPDKGHY